MDEYEVSATVYAYLISLSVLIIMEVMDDMGLKTAQRE